MPSAPIVIVGGGLAAATAARTLRKEGFDGEVVVFTAEAQHPYERPPLTKGYLRAEADRSTIFTLDETWYDENSVDVRRGSTVVGLDAAAHRLTLADGTSTRYEKLLLATGSAPRPISVPGASLQDVLLLRTVDSADLLRATLEWAKDDNAGRLVVIGDGWIGMEAAASARQLGLEVTVIGRGPVPLARVLGEQMGEVYASLHSDNGVELRRNANIKHIVGADAKATGIELEGGERIDAALVLVGIGVTPNVGIAAAAGIELRAGDLGGGIAVDGRLATSHPDVYAAGDIASIPIPRWQRPIRVEHWATANRTGPHAARAMLGGDSEYTRMPYFYSDQFDTSMEYSGFVSDPAKAQVVVSGDVERREFVAFWLEEGVVQAGMSVNVPERIADIEAIISARQPVAEEELRSFVG